jgi:hypothetical protein
VGSAVYLTSTQLGKNSLYVAEAHSNGTHFKNGIGINLDTDFEYSKEEPYRIGKMPLEELEALRKQYGILPNTLSLEFYLANFTAIQKEMKEKSEVPTLIRKDKDFYRGLRISRTGWPDLLFGKK